MSLRDHLKREHTWQVLETSLQGDGAWTRLGAMSLMGGQPLDVEARLELLSQQLDRLEAWYKRTFIASWVVLAVAMGFLLYSSLPSQLKPLADRLNDMNGRLERIEIKLDTIGKQISAIATQMEASRPQTAKPVAQPKTPAPPSRRTRKRPARR